MSRRSFPLWSLLGVVLVAALVVGSGVLSSAPPSAAQRAASIESVLRCPSCEATIRQMVDQGRTDQQVESYLTSRYGNSIVLDPPASGWTLLVWLLPLVGGVVTVGIVVLVVVRRRRGAGTDVDLTTTAVLDGVSLEERKRFLDQSLADADAEYLAGDLSDKDYLTLRRRDMSRLAALAGGGTSVVVGATAAAPPPGSSDDTWPSPAASSSTTRILRPATRFRYISARSSRPKSRMPFWPTTASPSTRRSTTPRSTGRRAPSC